MIRIIPSLASANQADLKGELQRLDGIARLHLDIEDGNFIPNITFGLRTVRDVARMCDMEMDAHLMVTDPYQYIEPLASLGVRGIAVHIEGLSYPMKTLNLIRNLDMRVGLALNPRTSLEELSYYAHALDYVLVMTAEPDLLGQQFQPRMLEKIKRLRAMLPNQAEIWADGGIKTFHLSILVDVGVSTVIMGRAIFEAEKPTELIKQLESRGV